MEEHKVKETAEKILTWIKDRHRRSFKVSEFKEDFKSILTRFVEKAMQSLVQDGSLHSDGSRVPLYTVNTDKVIWESEEEDDDDSDAVSSEADDAFRPAGKKRSRPAADSSPPSRRSKAPKVKNVKPRQEPLWWEEESEEAEHDDDSGSVYESDDDDDAQSESTMEQSLASSRVQMLDRTLTNKETLHRPKLSSTSLLPRDRTPINDKDDRKESQNKNKSCDSNALPLKKQVLDCVAGRHPHNLFPLLVRLCEENDATTIFDILDVLKELEEDCMLKVYVMAT